MNNHIWHETFYYVKTKKSAKRLPPVSVELVTSCHSSLMFDAFDSFIFTARKRSCGKVMFLQVSVILSTGGGTCMVAPGGVCDCSRGACMVASGGNAWLLLGGVCMVAPGGACVVAPRGMCMACTTGDGDMINERAVRILLECILVCFWFFFT